MRTKDVNFLNDHLFKYIFANEKHKGVTLSFINAVLGLEGTRAFVDLQFAHTARGARSVDGKATVLDFSCITSDGTQVNIEVQIRDQHNIVRRTLYYWAQCYQEPLRRGEDYRMLRRTVTINLLGYRFLPQDDFHSVYRLYNPATQHLLTDDIEVHFLEMPKVPRAAKRDLRGMRLLEKWMVFLNNKLSDEEMEALVMSEAALKEAWDAMEDFLRDARRRSAYRQREKAERDYISEMNFMREEGLEKGIAEGRAQGIAEEREKAEQQVRDITLRLLKSGTGAAAVADIVARPVSEIQKIAEAHGIPQS